MIGRLKFFIQKIKSRKRIFLHIFAIVFLFALLAGIIGSTYLGKDKNISHANKNSQILVFDLDSGERVSVDKIMKNPKKGPPTPATPAKMTQVTVIIYNLGLNNSDAEKAIALPKEFVLSFSPYSENSFQLSQNAAQAGHAVLSDLPMQMKDATENPGNLALMVENNDFRNLNNLSAVLSKVDNPSGVLSEPGEIFTRSNNFVPVLQALSQHKIYLVYGGDGEDIDQRAKDNDVELLKVDTVLDETKTLPDFAAQLASLEDTSRKNGFAVGLIKSPSSDALEKLSKWAEELKNKNIKLNSSTK